MTLLEFLQKWESPGSNQLSIFLHASFECDIRTFYRWKNATPRHAQLALKAIDRLWEQTGKDFASLIDG